MVDVPRERFEELVADALDGIPEELGQYMDNVAVFVEDVPPQRGLLGLYQGVPLTARGISYSGTMPDRISIYRRTICAISKSEEEVVEQVRRTVVHEVAHHFGIDDPRLRELGW
jgi:predicted Zn-dependent protease with MMP-like domain